MDERGPGRPAKGLEVDEQGRPYQGSTIRQLRKQWGLQVEDLAQAIGMKPKSIYSLERNRFSPSADKLAKLALVLHTPLEQLEAAPIHPRILSAQSEHTESHINVADLLSSSTSLVTREEFNTLSESVKSIGDQINWLCDFIKHNERGGASIASDNLDVIDSSVTRRLTMGLSKHQRTVELFVSLHVGVESGADQLIARLRSAADQELKEEVKFWERIRFCERLRDTLDLGFDVLKSNIELLISGYHKYHAQSGGQPPADQLFAYQRAFAMYTKAHGSSGASARRIIEKLRNATDLRSKKIVGFLESMNHLAQLAEILDSDFESLKADIRLLISDYHKYYPDTKQVQTALQMKEDANLIERSV